LHYIPKQTLASFIDIGTGAGFPGYDNQDRKTSVGSYFMDSLRKRIVFLFGMRNELNLNGIYYGPCESGGSGKIIAMRGHI
jgi:16S rRNA G527 N7-methylase RsmG